MNDHSETSAPAQRPVLPPAPVPTQTSAAADRSGVGPWLRAYQVLVGAVLIAVTLLVSAAIIASSGEESEAYKWGFGMGAANHTEGTVDEICDEVYVDVPDERIPTNAERSDWLDGCRDGHRYGREE